MSKEDEIPRIEGYVSVKEAAQILQVSEKMVYFYIESKRLPAVRASNILLIPTQELKTFEQKSVGRPRTRTPAWRKFSKSNQLFATSITVQMQAGKQSEFTKKIEKIRKDGSHVFPGTVARYIIEYETLAGTVEILLVWKTSAAPDEASREADLEALRQALADVLEWSTAQYNSGTVLIHT